mmetsp:Transcript_42244/g.83358  ORF Transcript_42244/g.83358 Transcript_42244/m.83358 type:complete len:82 (-) Transcript_42244:117-362(-)
MHGFMSTHKKGEKREHASGQATHSSQQADTQRFSLPTWLHACTDRSIQQTPTRLLPCNRYLSQSIKFHLSVSLSLSAQPMK